MKQKFFIFACFAVIFATFLSSNVYAANIEDYPNNIGWVIDNTTAMVIYESNDGTIKAMRNYLFDGNKDDSVKITLSGSNLVLENSVKVKYYKYTLNDAGTAWTQYNEYISNAGSAVTLESDVKTIKASNVDVVDPSGKVVFPLPPAPPLEVAVTEALETLQTKTLTTMETLTLCGVGLMALLVALVILPKVLYKFL